MSEAKLLEPTPDAEPRHARRRFRLAPVVAVAYRPVALARYALHLFGLALFGLALVALTPAGQPAAAAQTAICTAEDFGRAVDSAGASLRQFNVENAPKLNAKLRQLKQAKGWNDDDEDMALDYLSDQRLTGFDNTANELLARIDTLGRPAEGKPLDCSKLDELKAASLELVAVMKAKSSHMTSKIDGELAASTTSRAPNASTGTATPADATKPAEAAKPAPTVATKAEPTPAAPSKSAEVARPAAPARPTPAPAPEQHAALPPPAPAPPPSAAKSPAKAVPPPVAAAPSRPPRGPTQPWSTSTEQHASNDPNPAAGPVPNSGPEMPAPVFVPPEEGYTIEEIRDATKGFFGTVSTNLATVIEHTFSSLGRPTGYVLGTEGGGAFLAGLRYGSGMLYMRSGGGRPVHWHGPSLGYDFGAAGSRTLFLIYGLHDPSTLFRTYTGVDGSAYVIGGFGVTFLKGGDVTMAPIRSGIGLRVGANIGYVRFTSEPSWNPF